MRRGTEVDRVIARLAVSNNRVVTKRALDAAGIGRRTVTHRSSRSRSNGSTGSTTRSTCSSHRVRVLDPADIGTRRGITATAPARR
jgi:hypothetical protein